MRRLIPFLKSPEQLPRETPDGGVVRRSSRLGLRAILRGSLAIGICAMITVGYVERERFLDGVITASVKSGLRL